MFEVGCGLGALERNSTRFVTPVMVRIRKTPRRASKSGSRAPEASGKSAARVVLMNVYSLIAKGGEVSM